MDQSMNKPEEINVVAAVVRHEGRILVSKRRKGVHLASMWEFPGGKPEAGESDREALIRELREETGMDIQPLHLIHRKTHAYPERIVNLHFYLCEPSPQSPSPRALEVAEIQWFTPSQLENMPFPEANRDLIRLIVEGSLETMEVGAE